MRVMRVVRLTTNDSSLRHAVICGNNGSTRLAYLTHMSVKANMTLFFTATSVDVSMRRPNAGTIFFAMSSCCKHIFARVTMANACSFVVGVKAH